MASSIFNSMDVDGSGAEDWAAQDETLLHVGVTPPKSVAGGSGSENVIKQEGHERVSGSKPAGSLWAAAGALQPRDATGNAGNASNAGTAPKKLSPRAKEREELNNGLLMFRNPQKIATVVVRNCAFPVHADLLCRHAEYFRRALRGGFAEAQTQRVELDGGDVAPDEFGLWIDLLYRWHFHAPGTFVLRKEQVGGTLSTRQILTLWQLSDRFLHAPLAALAEESLQHRLGLYSVEQWRKLYRTRPSSDIRARVARLQEAYRLCVDRGLPFADAVVEACANCPPQVYADCVDLLEPEFMALVSRRMILAHADAQLLGRDRRPVPVPGSAAAAAAAAAATASTTHLPGPTNEH